MLDKLLYSLLTVVFAIFAIKTFTYWLITKYKGSLSPKSTKVARERISKQFNNLLKTKQLRRKDILEVKGMLKKYSEHKKYNSDAHMIYSTLKYKEIPLPVLNYLSEYLEKCRIKNKKARE